MKPYLIALALIVLIVGALGSVKFFQIQVLTAPPPAFPPTIVTSATVEAKEWEKTYSAIGSVTAVQGVTVSAEVGGQVVSIQFESGSEAKEGGLLVQLNVETESAQLRAAEAQLQLARRDVERAQRMIEQKSMSTADYDAADAQYKKALAEADTIKAAIAKKTIRAPFSGQLGIRQVNVGQVIDAGTPIVSLQSLDPVHVDFALPQQRLGDLKPGLVVNVKVDAFPDRIFSGKLTAINPDVNSKSRAVSIQATFDNPGCELRPGMFAEAQVVLEQHESVVLAPATSILYSPFGDSVFVIEPPKADAVAGQPGANDKGENHGQKAAAPDPSGGGASPPALVLRQANVRVGETRGDFVAVTGVNAGEQVVSSGVFKLTNGMRVSIDNRLAPKPELAPKPADS